MTRHSRKASGGPDRAGAWGSCLVVALARRVASAARRPAWGSAAAGGLAAGMAAGLAGCGDPAKEVSFEATDPAARIRAIKEAARTEDRDAIPQLIESLDSEDPMQRLVSIRALEKMTGQTLGYDHAAPWWERNEAVLRWVEWAREEGLAPRPRSADEWSGGEEEPADSVQPDAPATLIPAAPDSGKGP